MHLNETHLNETHLNETQLNETHLNETHLNETHLNETHRKKTRDINSPLVLAKWSTENLNENVCPSISLLYMR
jgi:hypothetical protein